MDRVELVALLRRCEAKLAEGRAAMDELAAALAEVSAAFESSEIEPATTTPLREVLASHRDELVNLVVATLENNANVRSRRDSFMRALVHRAEDDSYRLGRRRIALTDTEKHLLDLLWRSMPEPISRQDILEALYPEGNKPAPGAIDVFVSKLRQKLKLASGGAEFIESIRGRGWALKPELCRQASVARSDAAGDLRRA